MNAKIARNPAATWRGPKKSKNWKLFSHRGHREHRDTEAENGKEFDPAPSKQVPQAFAFSFLFLNVNPSVVSVTSVANKFLIFLSFIFFWLNCFKIGRRVRPGRELPFPR
jgi:hypothetical protein